MPFVTGYEDLIPGLHLPDPGDRHVLAAAIRGRADVIVTMNLKDFPDAVLNSFGIEAQHPDEFILQPARPLAGYRAVGCASASGEPKKTARKPNQNIWIRWSVRVSRRRYRFCASTSAPSRARPCRPAIPYAGIPVAESDAKLANAISHKTDWTLFWTLCSRPSGTARERFKRLPAGSRLESTRLKVAGYGWKPS